MGAMKDYTIAYRIIHMPKRARSEKHAGLHIGASLHDSPARPGGWAAFAARAIQHWAPHMIVGFAFALRAANITGESLWRDEVDTIRFAFVSLGQLLGNLTRAGFNGPFYHLLMRGWLTLAGVNDFAVRYFSLLCGVAQVAMIFALVRRLFGRRVAVIAMGLSAIAPALIWYGAEGKMYTLQPLLIVTALYALRRATWDARGSARWWSVFVVATSLGYYTHLLTPLFLPVAGVFALSWLTHTRRHWKGAAVALGLCTLPYLPLVVWQLPLWLRGGDSGHLAQPLDVMALSLLYNWSIGLSSRPPFDIGTPSIWLGILSFTTLAALGAVAAYQRRQWAVNGVVAWLMLPTALVFLVSLRVPVFQPRYLLWCAPALYVLAALGVAQLWQRGVLLAGLTVVWLGAFSAWGIVAQAAQPIRPDLRGAAQYLAAHLAPDDKLVFQIPYTRFAFQYYLPHFAPSLPVDARPAPDDGLSTLAGLRQRIMDGPYTNNAGTPASVDTALRALIRPDQRIWLIEAEVPLWDEQGLTRMWFEQHMALSSRRDFRGVAVSLYEVRLPYRVYLPGVTAPPLNAEKTPGER